MADFDATIPMQIELAKLIDPYRADINTALATRDLSLVAFVIIIADLITSHSEERRLVWTAPRSWAKYAFLANRYLVPVCVAVAFLPLSGFIGLELTNEQCLSFAISLSFIAVCSMGVSNALVVVWVVNVWDHTPLVVMIMIASAITVWVVAAASILIALKLYFVFPWSPLLSMCVVTRASPLTIAAWGAPLVFELVVLVALVWNALDRPRTSHTPLTRALLADGIIHFGFIACLRVMQVALAAAGPPRLVPLTSVFAWALVTVTTGRALLSLRRVEEQTTIHPRAHLGRAKSPFGLPIQYLDGSAEACWSAASLEQKKNTSMSMSGHEVMGTIAVDVTQAHR